MRVALVPPAQPGSCNFDVCGLKVAFQCGIVPLRLSSFKCINTLE